MTFLFEQMTETSNLPWQTDLCKILGARVKIQSKIEEKLAEIRDIYPNI